MNYSEEQKFNLVKKADVMLNYITELTDESNLRDYVLPNLGFTGKEIEAIIGGYFDNDDRLLDVFDNLVNQVMEAVKEEKEIKRVFFKFGFSLSEMIEHEIVPSLENLLNLEDLIILDITDRQDGSVIMTIAVYSFQEEEAKDVINQAEQDWYKDAECNLHYQYEKDADLIKARLKQHNIIFNDVVHYIKA